jgi:hypothetical protein
MNLERNGFRVSSVVVALSLSLVPTTLTGECILAKPLRVRRVCGRVVNEEGFPWPGTLRLTRRNASHGTKGFEQIAKTDDEGRFDIKDIPAGEYEIRLTPAAAREVFVPVLVDLYRPKRDGICVKPMDLKLNFLPEPCVSRELRKPTK